MVGGELALIFTKPHQELIRQGLKTQTHRLGKRRWQVGAVHPVKAGWYDRPGLWIRILAVAHSALGAMTEADAKAEGYHSLLSYKAAWERIFRQAWDDALPVWVITFCLHDGPEPKSKQVTLFDEEG